MGLAPVGKREGIVRVVQLLTYGVAVGRVIGLLTTNMELTDKLSTLVRHRDIASVCMVALQLTQSTSLCSVRKRKCDTQQRQQQTNNHTFGGPENFLGNLREGQIFCTMFQIHEEENEAPIVCHIIVRIASKQMVTCLIIDCLEMAIRSGASPPFVHRTSS